MQKCRMPEWQRHLISTVVHCVNLIADHVPRYLCSADAAKENIVPLPEYDVFKDAAFQQPQRSRSSTLVSAQGQGQSAGGVAATGVQNWEALVSDGLLCTIATRCHIDDKFRGHFTS
jgi:hypothetical protein